MRTSDFFCAKPLRIDQKNDKNPSIILCSVDLPAPVFIRIRKTAGATTIFGENVSSYLRRASVRGEGRRQESRHAGNQ
jgi:hypothetical protein